MKPCTRCNGTERNSQNKCLVCARVYQKRKREKWSESDKERNREYTRKYRIKNKDALNEKDRTTYPARVDKRRASNVRRKYGITWEEYERMLTEQAGACAICSRTDPGRRKGVMLVDHCHATKKVRGLLCHRCNAALGMFGDDPEVIKKAMEYVLKHK